MPSRRDEELVESTSPIIADRGDRGGRSAGKIKSEKRKASVKPASKGSSGGTKLMLVVAVVGLVGLAAWIAELQKQLQASSNLLVGYEQNMQALEDRLSITDESMLQSDSQFEDKVKSLDSEVRKLWDNVWKKTKTELAKHNKLIAAQKKELANLKAASQKQDAQLKSQLGASQIAISALDEQIGVASDNSAAISQLNAQITGLAQSLKAVKESSGSLTTQQEDLLKRINETEEWVESFNGYRREVNQKLLRLEGTQTP